MQAVSAWTGNTTCSRRLTVKSVTGVPRGSVVKSPPAVQETQETRVQSLGWEDPLEEGMASHSSILAWRIPMDRIAWWAAVRGVAELDMTE